MCMYMYLCKCMLQMYLQKLKEDMKSPGAGVTGTVIHLTWVLGTALCSLVFYP